MTTESTQALTNSVTPSTAVAEVRHGSIRVDAAPPDDSWIHQEIGKIAAGWARLEHALDLIISDLLGLEHRISACVTSQILGVHYRVSAIVALAEALKLEKDLISKIRVFGVCCEGPQAERNRFVHDPWHIEAMSGDVAQFKSWPKGDHRFGVYKISETKIKKLQGRIRRRVQEAVTLREEIRVERAP